MQAHTELRKRNSAAQKGFTLLETMIALVVLAIGILGLAAMLGESLEYMHGAEEDFIAQQKAQEAVEAIFTAKYTNNASFAQVANNTAGTPQGLFLTGPQPLLQVGPDGLVGSINDVGAPQAYVVYPGADQKLGTADDLQLPLSNFTRTITITPVPGEPYVQNVLVRVDYSTGRFVRSYSLSTFVSAY